jgi:hypothetical protein
MSRWLQCPGVRYILQDPTNCLVERFSDCHSDFNIDRGQRCCREHCVSCSCSLNSSSRCAAHNLAQMRKGQQEQGLLTCSNGAGGMSTRQGTSPAVVAALVAEAAWAAAIATGCRLWRRSGHRVPQPIPNLPMPVKWPTRARATLLHDEPTVARAQGKVPHCCQPQQQQQHQQRQPVVTCVRYGVHDCFSHWPSG